MENTKAEDKGISADLDMIRGFWIEAEDDLDAAERLLIEGKYSKVMYLCAQFLEKLMKICLTCEGVIDIKSHGITGLFGKYVIAASPKRWKDRLEKIGRQIKLIERQYPKFRYPLRKGEDVWIPSLEYTKQDAYDALEISKKAKQIFLEFLKGARSLDLKKLGKGGKNG
ncbi:MAG: HEPN domain-containing protein [Candidatus Aenigmarchaeota archaeon]|nr:HEPN domain-containing protein [Candidatus Aenigmarchaeota archaeon]